MSYSRYRPASRRVQPCGCNPYAGVICTSCREAFRASDNCWTCGDGVPVAMHDGKPVCQKCRDAIRESAPRLEVAS